MALTTAQEWQVARLPIADSSISTGDEWAIGGLIEALSAPAYVLTNVQRAQIVRLGIADSSITEGDEWAIAWLVQSLNAGGSAIEVFEITWRVDPTWTAVQQVFDGDLGISMDTFSLDLVGQSVFASVVASTTNQYIERKPKRRARTLETVFGGEHNWNRKSRE